jgi:cytochrome c
MARVVVHLREAWQWNNSRAEGWCGSIPSMHHGNAIAAGFCLAGLLTALAAMADEPVGFTRGDRLLAKYQCQACHQPYDQGPGPSLHAIAARHAEDPHAIEVLESAILNGSSGAWGPVPMAGYDVPERDLKPLVEWILSLRLAAPESP